MLTQQQLQQNFSNSSANTAGSASVPATNDWVDSLSAPQPDDSSSGITGYLGNVASREIPNLIQGVSGAATDVANRFTNTKDFIDKTAADPNIGLAKGAGESVLHGLGQTAGAIGDVLGQGIKTVYKTVTPQSAQDAIKNGAASVLASSEGQQGLALAAKGKDAYDSWKQQNPQSADALESIINIGSLIPIGKGASLAKDGLESLAEKAPGVINDVAQTLGKAGEVVGNKASDAVDALKSKITPKNNPIQDTIDAVNPDLSGKKLASGYEQVVKGDRSVTPSGIFTEQSLSPSERSINLGKRLNDTVILQDGSKIEPVTLSKDHVENLPKLKTALTDTESKLQEALQGNPEINYNADKPTLFQALKKGQEEIPRGFRIGPDKAVADDVFNFANKVASEADDSISGIREARTAFDNQSKTQYPAAFKEGAIDTKTAAGAAIKKARDIFNEHLYNTAPNGSDIQKLIGREADILQATEPVATKAAKGEGMTKVEKAVKFVKEHPVASTAATAATTYGAMKAAGQ
jgi:ElaB/YqjD/DUF883 family membrane-anchored ribosome-binding protein